MTQTAQRDASGNLFGDAVILTGGRGRRLGQRKESALLGDRSLLEIQIDRWSSHFDRIWISCRDATESEIPAQLPVIADPPQVESVIDLLPPLLDKIDRPFWLIAVDMPIVPLEIPTTLIAAYRPGTCVFPEQERGLEMLCGIYDPEARDSIESLRRQGKRALSNIAKHSSSQILRYPQDFPKVTGPALKLGPFFNVNTPADLHKLRSEYEGSPHGNDAEEKDSP